ncbi:MAG TPA: GAF domain-containing sensor histidine kinase [Balneolaceae bacterium]
MKNKKVKVGDSLKRLQYLAAYSLELDGRKEELNSFTGITKYVTGASVCEINILDAYNQWTIAGPGEEMKVIAREDSVCNTTIAKDELFEVRDLKKDSRFKNRDYVAGGPQYRYYCGVPLKTSDNINIGTVCVLDTEPKDLSAPQKKQLRNIGDLLVNKIETESRYKKKLRRLHDLTNSFHKLNHDIRGPINGVVGITDMLIHKAEKGDAISTDKLAIIKDCAKTIVEMIDGILAKIGIASDSDDEKATTSISQIINKIECLYKPQALKKDISLRLHKPEDKVLAMKGYFLTSLIQIVGNLVSNSLKFTSKGGSVDVHFAIADKNRNLKIRVADMGKGMSKEQVSAFNNEQSVSGTEGTNGEASFGIGLMHVKNLVNLEGGRIEVESTPGKGTTFFVWLPV